MSTTPLTPEIVSQEGNAMVLSMGPQHPSTHGVLQIMLEISGENIVKAEPEIGYLHTGIEKTAENLFWSQAQTVIERMDYLAPSSNAYCYCLAVEQLLGLTDRIPERARQIRVLQAELTRIASHCVWLGTHGIDLGALSAFFYCFDMREKILDLQEATGGARMHPNYLRVGGVQADLPSGFMEQLDELIDMFPGRMRDLRALLQANPILQDRSGASPARRCARPASPTTCGALFRTAATRSTSSISSRALRVIHTRAFSFVWTRWNNRCASCVKCAPRSNPDRSPSTTRKSCRRPKRRLRFQWKR